MVNELLEVKVKIRIAKPAQEVFEALVYPTIMSRYFSSLPECILEY